MLNDKCSQFRIFLTISTPTQTPLLNDLFPNLIDLFSIHISYMWNSEICIYELCDKLASFTLLSKIFHVMIY